MHAFSDASEAGYGSCIYLKCVRHDGVSISLMCSKSRVAPIKTTSIPRLELCACLLLVRLVFKVLDAIDLTISNIYCWTDSEISLAWIRSHPSRWTTFVANRVAEIQTLTTAEWRHVPTKDNPADMVSRGVSAQDLLHNDLWWHGPQWLSLDKDDWPVKLVGNHNLEEKTVALATVSEDFDLFTRYSSFDKLRRITAWCFRFYSHLKRPDSRKFGALTMPEINSAVDKLLIISQSRSFTDEIRNLQKNQPTSKSSKLLKLHPYLDTDGLLRVGGRLLHCNVPRDKKNPILIDGSHPLARLIVEYEHKRLLHAGPRLLLASLRNKFWITSARNVIRNVTRKCVTCFRIKPVTAEADMGHLPKERVNPSRPFEHTGVDYAGPIIGRDKLGRGCKDVKFYICLFVCLCTKAVHLEIVSDLTTNAFIAAMRRFVARRGVPSRMFSGNGTNFVGGKNEIKELYKFLIDEEEMITNQLCTEGIEWSFIPARAPHFGGLWEAGVRVAKYHLKRIVGLCKLTYEDLSTVVTQIESCLNSRPLYPLSQDVDDLNPITPSHLLNGYKLTSLPDSDLSHLPESRLSRFEYLQKLSRDFWKSWHNDYLSELQTRHKWNCQTTESPIQIGRLVTLKEDNLPPLKWKMGRITELHPGDDGITRVVTVKTFNGELKRSIRKVCVLPIYERECA